MTGRCSSCGAPVLWAQTPSGKPQPIEPDPIVNGNIALEKNPKTGGVMSVPYSALLHPGADRYQTHFVTCPHADEGSDVKPDRKRKRTTKRGRR